MKGGTIKNESECNKIWLKFNLVSSNKMLSYEKILSSEKKQYLVIKVIQWELLSSDNILVW